MTLKVNQCMILAPVLVIWCITTLLETISFSLHIPYMKLVFVCVYARTQCDYEYLTLKALLILAGFGNLNGHLEIWDLRNKKEICRTHARDTTYLEWCPDGEYFLTATLSPRLRVGNG